MQFLKKYYLIIAPLALAVVALIGTWVWVSSAFGTLVRDMNRANRTQDISRLTAEREAIVDTGPNARREAVFPNQTNIALWQTRKAELDAQQKAIRDKIRQFNFERWNNALPKVQMGAMKVGEPGEYQKWYRTAMQNLIKSLDPTRLPTLGDVQAELERLRQEKKVDPALSVGIIGGPTAARPGEATDASGGRLVSDFDKANLLTTEAGSQTEEGRKLVQEAIEKSRLDAAQRGAIYARLPNLTISEIYDQNEPPTDVQAWYAQLGYWMQSDAIEAIKRVNDAAAAKIDPAKLTVFTAPVKYLVGIQVSNYVTGENGAIEGANPDPNVMPVQLPDIRALSPVSGTAAGGEKRIRVPTLLRPAGDAPSGQQVDDVFSLETSGQVVGGHSFTGRRTNDLYGVTRMTVQVVIDSRKIPELLDALCKVNLYTIVKVRVDKVSDNLTTDFGFRFGPDPVALLTFQAELLMFHEYFDGFLPKELRAALMRPAPKPADAAAGDAGAGNAQ